MVGVHHRFAVVLAADCAHYCRQVEERPDQTVAKLRSCRTAFARCVLAHDGREFGSAGDSLMAEFSSPIEALRAALMFQTLLSSKSPTKPALHQLQFRVGLHEGDVITDEDELYGDIVNIAARLQELAPSGGIVMSSLFYEHVHKEPGLYFRPLGSFRLKGISEPETIYEARVKRSPVNWRRIGFSIRNYEPAIFATLIIIAGVFVIRWYAETYVPVSEPIEVGPAVPSSVFENSIAVLPFADLSPEGDQDYLCDSIAEEILNHLAQVPDLHVSSRSSSFSFKGKDMDIPSVARQLNVAYILEGSVRKLGERVRITTQLIDARTDTYIWSATYERDSADIFAVQDEISAAIAGTLKELLELQVAPGPRATSTANSAEDGCFIRPKKAQSQVPGDEQRFAPSLAAQEARQAREQREFLNVVGRDNPYAAVWRPVEGTCIR